MLSLCIGCLYYRTVRKNKNKRPSRRPYQADKRKKKKKSKREALVASERISRTIVYESIRRRDLCYIYIYKKYILL